MMDLPTDPWRVSLPVFEGPLDLLLYLIKKAEVDIYDIEIASITDQYLAYLEQMARHDLEIAGEFLVVAANLIYIKSRTLLPADQQPPEEEAEEEDPRWELIRQLVEYKKFKDAAGDFGARERLRELIYHRKAKPVVAAAESGLKKPVLGRVSVLDLVKAFQTVLQRARERDGFKEIYEDKFSVSDKIQAILELIERDGRLRFFELFNDMTSRTEIAVTFLALLELIRLKQLKCVQSDVFGDIDILRVGA